MTYFDLPFMGQSALGTHWAATPPAQRERFLKAVVSAEARAYSERFGQYGGQIYKADSNGNTYPFLQMDGFENAYAVADRAELLSWYGIDVDIPLFLISMLRRHRAPTSHRLWRTGEPWKFQYRWIRASIPARP